MFKILPINLVLRSFKKQEYTFEYNLTRRCNLNCKNCSRFAKFYDKSSDVSFEEFKEDFDHLLEFSDFKNIKHTILSGGEATIVKDFFKIIEYIRSNFDGTISVCTNGAKILTFSESELERLKRSKVIFIVTKYPFSTINYEKVFQILDQSGIEHQNFKDFDESENDRVVFSNRFIISKKLKTFFRKIGQCCAFLPYFYKGKVYACSDAIPGKREFNGAPLKEFESFKEVIRFVLNDHEKDYFCERCLREIRISTWEVDKSNSIDFYLLSKKDEEYYCE